MTDSVRGGNASATRPGKRERLVAAARELVHRQGVERTTLADIAQAADVPLGNVYYYFKTKDDILAAVVQTRAQEMESALAELVRRHRGPKARLKGLVRLLADRRDSIAQHGCPHGTLCSELVKRSGGPDPLAAPLMQIPIGWAEEQFRCMGRRDAHDLAVEMVALYQGSAVLTSALREPDLMTRQARRLEKWIDSI